MLHTNTRDTVIVSRGGIIATSSASSVGDSSSTRVTTPTKVEVVRALEAPVTGSVKDLIDAEFGAGHIMYWVALNESDLDPTAESGTGPVGVFQIAGITWRDYDCTGNRYNAYDNIQCARKIYDKRGLKDWRWSEYHGSHGGWHKNLATANM